MLRLTVVASVFALAIANPASAQDSKLVAEARAAAQADRNAEAARLFAEAITADPSQRGELLREYADQLTYSDRAAEAVPLYREALAARSLDPASREPMIRGLALALAWSGQHRAAIAAYDMILVQDPLDREALAMRGKVKGWSRDYDGAEADLRAALSLDPNNADTIRALAQVQSYAGRHRGALATLKLLPDDLDGESARQLARTQLWSGRPQAARESLAQILLLDPTDAGALALNADARRAIRPLTEMSLRYSDQSNASDFWQAAAWQTIWPSDVLAIGLGYDGFYFRPDGADNLDVHRPSASMRARLSDLVELNGQLGLTIIEDASPIGGDRALATWNGWVTVIPSDHLRIDAGINRSTLDNPRSNLLGIHTDTVSASVDLGSDAAWKLSLRGNYSAFSDDNNRLWGQAELRRRIAWSPNLFLGARITQFSFDKITDNGYFSPDKLEAIEATAHAWGRLGTWWYDIKGAIGRENADPGDARTTYSAEGKLTIPVSGQVEVDLFINSFSSRFAAPGGFSRTTTGLSLRTRW